MVAFHFVMSVLLGKAEMPGVGEVISVMSSDCRLSQDGYVSAGLSRW